MANTLNTVNLPLNNGPTGSFLTSNGSNGVTWAGATISNTSLSPILTVPVNSNTLEVKGNVVINGVDLEERLRTIEKVLMIPERDPVLEASYPLLKKKYEDYINTLSKYRMWENIKGENK